MIKKIEKSKLLEIINKHDYESYYNKRSLMPDETELEKELEEYVDFDSITEKSIVGIDIYKYASYNDVNQSLVPFVFDILYHKTIDYCLNNNSFLFQNYTEKKIVDSFIDIGDGGFTVFDTPLHSLVFALNFEMMRRAYNSYHIYPKLRKMVGGITNRYAITYDKIYSYNKNHYGRGIINNSRILAKDNLNRCLIDQKTHDWFIFSTDGIENLQILDLRQLKNIIELDDYDQKLIKTRNNELFNPNTVREYGIINSDISKIGSIHSKETELNIYNIHIQATMKVNKIDKNNSRLITVSLGNLNTNGF